MFYIISKILAFLSKPIIWIFILLINALIFKTKRRKMLYITLFIFYLFTNSFIADKCSRIWETSPILISSLKHKYKYGIVLGGYSSYNKTIQHINFNDSGDRLISALELYKLGKIEKIIISGGNGDLINDGMMESEWSKSFLLNMGVEIEDMLLENSSRNTMENAQKTAINAGKPTARDLASRWLATRPGFVQQIMHTKQYVALIKHATRLVSSA